MINLFFSYSHKDEQLRDELDKHLSILKRQKIINTFHDRRIYAGSDFSNEINSNLKTADIILLLVSSDFLASDYCYDNEMQYALARHERKEATVIPVILRPCDWQTSPFGKLMAIPKDGKPVTKFSCYDDAFLEITNEIKRLVNIVNERNEVIQEEASTSFPENTPFSRSSNLRITKSFSDHDKATFLDSAFEYINNYFEHSLKELKVRNPEIDYRFKRIDPQTFTASVYMEGGLKAQCMIYYGEGMFPNSINYSNSSSGSKNSFNECFHVADDGYMQFLRPSGLTMFGNKRLFKEEEKMTNEGGAEYFWQMFIDPLQRK